MREQFFILCTGPFGADRDLHWWPQLQMVHIEGGEGSDMRIELEAARMDLPVADPFTCRRPPQANVAHACCENTEDVIVVSA